MNNLSPIVVFVYNRLWHTIETINSLKNNKFAEESDLFIYSDAAKNNDVSKSVEDVREYIKTISGFKKITIIERKENCGLAKSIIDGVTSIVNKYGKVIVLEDDLVTSPYFLSYMNESLERYADDERVISIHGYVYPVKQELPDVFFIPGADCWGWGTWKRGWDIFNPDGQQLLDELKRRKLTKKFDFNGAYAYTRMLKDQIRGANDSWAIRWHASAFLANKFTMYPGRSLVKNIGHDNSGTHCTESNRLDVILSDKPINISQGAVEFSMVGWQAFETFLRQPKINIIYRVLRKVSLYMRKLLP